MTENRLRPDPVRWVWYAFGGTLPQRYRAWVLHDLTCRTRWLRQFARTAVILLPFVIVGLILAGGGWIVWMSALGGLGLATVYSVSYIDQYAEHRLRKHGFPDGTFRQVMGEAHQQVTADRDRKYDAMYRNANAGS